MFNKVHGLRFQGIQNVQSETIEKKSTITSVPNNEQSKTWYEEILEERERNSLNKSDSIEPENPTDTTQPSFELNDEDSCEDDTESLCNKIEVEISYWLPSFKIVDRDFQV